MRLLLLVLAGAILVSCGDTGPGTSETWLGDACGVPDLKFSVSERRKLITLAEYQVQGTVMTDSGIGTAPTTDRQKLIEGALTCLKREAKRRGLGLEYPVMNVDA